MKLIDLRPLLNGMRELIEQSLGPSIRLTVSVAPEGAWVKTDANQLELALLNLAVNARDAMPDGGVLEIAAGLRDSRTVEIAVRDTGSGMPPQVVERALDPFFTTKEAGKGTGLGLSQVYGLMRQSNGAVDIESAPGAGTTVRLQLPRAQPPAVDAAVAKTSPTGAGKTDAARILLLDDEDDVRAFMAEVLRDAGHTVLDASNGEAALAALPDFQPDLMVVDFVMPGMNGAEAARRARLLKPGLAVLVVSGYADSEALALAIGDAPVLRKPFDGSTLSDAVAEALRR